jgi:tetratricopeptide (TPR) repeat protein
MRTQRTSPATNPKSETRVGQPHALSLSKGIPNQTRMPKARNKSGFVRRRAGSFVIRISDLIRHSGFGFLVFAAACTTNPQSQQQLSIAKQSLQSQQYDPAIRNADAVIAANNPPDLAEAYYLRGYAIENRPKSGTADAVRDLSLARESYLSGLSHDPAPSVAGRLHAQLGNVTFYQDDYPTALREFDAALTLADDPQNKPLILYHMGVCEQRLGRFDDADRTFQRVEQQYPNSEFVPYARSREGIRGFYVQVGAYSQPADIQKAAKAVASAGSAPLKTNDKGLTVIRTSSVPSYDEAQDLKTRLASRYPDARIMP